MAHVPPRPIPLPKQPLFQTLEEQKLWGNIHRRALIDAGLKDLLEKCEMYYRLLEENK